MIFDGHAYCFPSLKGDGGFGDPNTLRRHLQHAMANHHAQVRRMRDGAPGDNSGLIDPSPGTGLESLKEAGFRAAHHGRFEWAEGGEGYFKQYLPPSIADMAYPPERLIAEMDYAGVDWALLHRTPYLGVGNDFIAGCVRTYPGRLKGLAHVQEWTVRADPDAAVQKVAVAVKEMGLSGLQFLPPQLNLYGQTGPWDATAFRPFWDGVARLKVPLFFSLAARQSGHRRHPSTVRAYLKELRTLVRWMERYPDARLVLTHGFPWRLFIEGDGIVLPDEVWEPFKNPNLSLQLLFPIALGGTWDYPMPQVRRTVEECVGRLGAGRLMWGTDMPIVTRWWTYRQNIEFITAYCDFLGPGDLERIMWRNAAELVGVEAG